MKKWYKIIDELTGFRPLDGESISKPLISLRINNPDSRFRPLDGESISKRSRQVQVLMLERFRPLDGESISKLGSLRWCSSSGGHLFPSPRRGINF